MEKRRLPKPPRNWPFGALPRLMDAACAAYYVGLSQTTFLARVQSGAYPEAIRDGHRYLWDCTALDAVVDGRFLADEKDRMMAAMMAGFEEEQRQADRILLAYQAGEPSRAIGTREKISTQKVAAIIRNHGPKEKASR